MWLTTANLFRMRFPRYIQKSERALRRGTSCISRLWEMRVFEATGNESWWLIPIFAQVTVLIAPHDPTAAVYVNNEKVVAGLARVGAKMKPINLMVRNK